MTWLRRPGAWAFALATAGVLLAAAFVVWAYHGTAYASSASDGSHGSASLMSLNSGLVSHLVMWAPLAAAVSAWLALHLACRRESERWRTIAQLLTGLLAGACLVEILSIGILILPTVLAMGLAATLTPTERRPAEHVV